MGWEEVKDTEKYELRALWGGWYPGKSHNDIPGELNNHNLPVGFTNCENAIWFDGRFKKMFGYDNVNTAALSGTTTITSLFYSTVLSDLLSTTNATIYANADNDPPSDVTGAVTVTPGNLVRWTDWQFTTTKFAVGVNGVDAPWKYTGAGNASALGGSPPTGRWVSSFQNALWIAALPTEPATVKFSNLGDAEVWSALDNYKFDAPITGMSVLGSMLVVFMDDHIGVMQGTNNRQLTKIDRFVNGVGCSGGHSIVNCRMQGQDVLVFHSNDGIYVFNGSANPIKISSPLNLKYTSRISADRFDTAQFIGCWGSLLPKYGWYLLSISEVGQSSNAIVLVFDLERTYQTSEGLVAPCWPMRDMARAMCFAVNPKASALASLYMGSSDGFIYLFSPSVFNRNGSGYTASGTTRVFPLDKQVLLQETNVLGSDTGSSSTVTVAINMDLSTGSGASGSASLATSGDLLDSTFILDTSILGGQAFLFANVDVGTYGRWLQIFIANSTIDEVMEIEAIEVIGTSVGLDPNIGN